MGSSARVLLIIILMNLLWYFRACYRLICVLVVTFNVFSILSLSLLIISLVLACCALVYIVWNGRNINQ